MEVIQTAVIKVVPLTLGLGAQRPQILPLLQRQRLLREVVTKAGATTPDMGAKEDSSVAL